MSGRGGNFQNVNGGRGSNGQVIFSQGGAFYNGNGNIDGNNNYTNTGTGVSDINLMNQNQSNPNYSSITLPSGTGNSVTAGSYAGSSARKSDRGNNNYPYSTGNPNGNYSVPQSLSARNNYSVPQSARKLFIEESDPIYATGQYSLSSMSLSKGKGMTPTLKPGRGPSGSSRSNRNKDQLSNRLIVGLDMPVSFHR